MYPIIKWLRAHTSMELILECSPEYLGNTSKILINGNWVGVIDKPLELVKMLKLYRRNGIIPTFVSISFNYQINEINIYTDAGRLTRPIYYIEDGNLSFNRQDVSDLFTNGKITWQQITSGFLPKSDHNFSIKSNITYDLNELYSEIGTNLEKVSTIIRSK